MLVYWAFAIVVAVGMIALGAVVFGAKHRNPPMVFANHREEQLTHQLATRLRCSLAAAQSAIRQELTIAPNQTDEVLLKRADYHFRMNLPEAAPCRVYRDRSLG
jgi:cytochrome c-type biogenesis protein CcmH/NrfF